MNIVQHGPLNEQHVLIKLAGDELHMFDERGELIATAKLGNGGGRELSKHAFGAGAYSVRHQYDLRKDER